MNHCAGLFEYKLLPMLLDLFVKYPFNNILHNLVLRAVLFILKSEVEPLLQHLYDDCHFANWLCFAPEEIEQPVGMQHYLLHAHCKRGLPYYIVVKL